MSSKRIYQPCQTCFAMVEISHMDRHMIAAHSIPDEELKLNERLPLVPPATGELTDVQVDSVTEVFNLRVQNEDLKVENEKLKEENRKLSNDLDEIWEKGGNFYNFIASKRLP